MPRLNEAQIEFIETDLIKKGISNPSLRLDLLDHICSAIEELPENYDFQFCYEEILSKFGGQKIKEIQFQTELLTNQFKNPRMKKAMFYSGIAASIFIFTASIFKIFHWPGAGALFVLGCGFLSLLFFPSMFMVRYKEKEENQRNIFLSLTGVLAAITVSLGMLFKIMHWPYATLLWISGVVILMFFYLPVYFVSQYKKAENKLNTMITSVMIVCGCGIFIIAFTFRNSAAVMEATFTHSKDLIKENLILMSLNESKINELIADTTNDSQTKNNLSAILKTEKEIDSLIRNAQSEIIRYDLEEENQENFNLLTSAWEKELQRNDLGDMEYLNENQEQRKIIQTLNSKLNWVSQNVKSNLKSSEKLVVSVQDFKGSVKNITLDRLSKIERAVHLQIAYLKK